MFRLHEYCGLEIKFLCIYFSPKFYVESVILCDPFFSPSGTFHYSEYYVILLICSHSIFVNGKVKAKYPQTHQLCDKITNKKAKHK